MTACPTCNKEHDTSMRMTGDVFHCPGCNAFLRVQHTAQGTRLVPAPVPPGGLALLLAADED